MILAVEMKNTNIIIVLCNKLLTEIHEQINKKMEKNTIDFSK